LTLERLRRRLVDVLVRAAADELVLGAAGNASARDPESDLVVVSPTSIPYERLRPADVSVVDASGRVAEGQTPTVELPMHLAVLAARPDVGAVLHTHSPYATALGCVLDEIPVVAPEQAAAVGGPVAVAPYAPTGTTEMGRPSWRQRTAAGPR
jgi:L-fuculose-phosphate aldolase